MKGDDYLTTLWRNHLSNEPAADGVAWSSWFLDGLRRNMVYMYDGISGGKVIWSMPDDGTLEAWPFKDERQTGEGADTRAYCGHVTFTVHADQLVAEYRTPNSPFSTRAGWIQPARAESDIELRAMVFGLVGWLLESMLTVNWDVSRTFTLQDGGWRGGKAMLDEARD